jgi:DNA helicase IV
LIERHVEDIERNLLSLEDFQYEKWTLFSGREAHELFHHEYRDWPVFKRIELLKKHFDKRVKERLAEFIQQLQEKCNADVAQIKQAIAICPQEADQGRFVHHPGRSGAGHSLPQRVQGLAACAVWRDLLQQHGIAAHIITGRENEYRGGMVIVPAYLAKGLEFDMVLIPDADSPVYMMNELDIKLLYMAITRALHRLHIYYHGEPSALLSDVEGA